MRQLAKQQAFFEPPLNAEPAGVDFNPLLMLAFERAVMPHILHRRSMFQPTRIVVVAPDSWAPFAAPFRAPIASEPEPRALLSAPAGPCGVPQLRQAESSAGYRKLFADPGQWRAVWWGEFKEILARQLAHPERLSDTYRLPCYVQVIETERTVAIEELAAIYKSDKTQTPLYVLTDDIAAKLELVLPLRAAPQHDAPRAPNTLLAHERVFRLVAANDPTIDVVATAKPKPPVQSPKAEESLAAKDKVLVSAPLKTAIPERFVKEWELKLSRDEATYDMNAKPTLMSFVRRFCGRLRILNRRKEFRKWQALLTGKNADEQLWAVHPPAGVLTDPIIRNWAETTLERSGYDAQKMSREWEIFWRRRGF
jgi:hypothetical protein